MGRPDSKRASHPGAQPSLEQAQSDARRSSPAAVIDALALASALCSLSLVLHATARGGTGSFAPTILAAVVASARELGLVFALWASLRLAFGVRDHHARRGAKPVAAGVFVLSTWLSLMAHNFYLMTGTAAELSVMGHAARRASELGGALASGLSYAFISRSVACLTILVGALLWAQRAKTARNSRFADAAGALSKRQLLLVSSLGWLFAFALPNFGLATPFRAAMWPTAFRPASDEGFSGEAEELAYERPTPRWATNAPPPPDIVLLVIESGRADILDDAHNAPNLHRFAREAYRPQRSYATTTHTTKALVGIMCGHPPAPEMELSESFPGGIATPCLPVLLASLGYQSTFVQSAQGEFEDRSTLIANLGFEQFISQDELLAANPQLEAWGYLAMDDRAMAAPLLEALDRADGPSFVAALSSTMHHPYEAVSSDGKGSGRPPRALYESALRLTDAWVGEVIDTLRSSGALDHTILVIVGDHGEAFGEHARQQHDAVPYEEAIRTPFLLHIPAAYRAPAQRVIPGNWQHIDILPTLMDAIAAPIQSPLPGRSLLDDATLASVTNRPISTSCWYEGWCATLIRGDDKLVHHYGRRPLERFDLGSDPGEKHNLAAELKPAQIRELEDLVLAHRAGVQNLWLAIRGGQVPQAPAQKAAPQNNARKPQCYDQCVRDSDPQQAGLQPTCTIIETHPSSASIEIPACTSKGLPSQAVACWNFRADDRLHPDCRAAGLNLELGIKRARRGRPGAMLDIRCSLSEHPSHDCPVDEPVRELVPEPIPKPVPE